MIELSNERIEQILHEETTKKEDQETILRSIYTRYMRLYEKYFADIDALNEDEIAKLRNYHEETISLVKYYYMNIPMDVCSGIKVFEKEYSTKLLGSEWQKYLSEAYEEFKDKYEYKYKDRVKAEFVKQALKAFYEEMDNIFRYGFGTGSETVKSVSNALKALLFGKEK